MSFLVSSLVWLLSSQRRVTKVNRAEGKKNKRSRREKDKERQNRRRGGETNTRGQRLPKINAQTVKQTVELRSKVWWRHRTQRGKKKSFLRESFLPTSAATEWPLDLGFRSRSFLRTGDPRSATNRPVYIEGGFDISWQFRPFFAKDARHGNEWRHTPPPGSFRERRYVYIFFVIFREKANQPFFSFLKKKTTTSTPAPWSMAWRLEVSSSTLWTRFRLLPTPPCPAELPWWLVEFVR